MRSVLNSTKLSLLIGLAWAMCFNQYCSHQGTACVNKTLRKLATTPRLHLVSHPTIEQCLAFSRFLAWFHIPRFAALALYATTSNWIWEYSSACMLVHYLICFVNPGIARAQHIMNGALCSDCSHACAYACSPFPALLYCQRDLMYIRSLFRGCRRRAVWIGANGTVQINKNQVLVQATKRCVRISYPK